MSRRMRQTGPPATERGMIQWLKDHPEEPFYTLHSGTHLLIGTRNDEGDLWAYKCTVIGHLLERESPAARPSRKAGGEP